MAIGLSNVNGRKAKRSTPKKSTVTTAVVTPPAVRTASAEVGESKTSSGEAWSARGLAREGRSARRERAVSGEVNPLWLEWTACVAGGETSTRVMRTVQRILDLEMFIFEFLVYDLDIPARAKKRILQIRSRGQRALQLRRLLMAGHNQNQK